MSYFSGVYLTLEQRSDFSLISCYGVLQPSCDCTEDCSCTCSKCSTFKANREESHTPDRQMDGKSHLEDLPWEKLAINSLCYWYQRSLRYADTIVILAEPVFRLLI